MERDDEQILRHSTRELARFLSIFYDELRAAGLPRKVAEQLTIGQWAQLQANSQVEQIAQNLLEGMMELNGDGDEDE